MAALPAPLNAVAVAPDGEIVSAGGDGAVYLLSETGERRGETDAGQTPIISLALSPDGSLIAAAGMRGSVGIIGRASRTLVRTLVGPGLPVWSVAFFRDNRALLTGGADGVIRRWDAISGEPIGDLVAGVPADPLAAFAGDHGAEVFRACVACHTLHADDGPRAGPTLAGIFGRRIATLPGYNFSPALKELGIVWTPATVAKLFERPPGLHPRHQDAGAADRLRRGPRRSGGIPRKGDTNEITRTNRVARIERPAKCGKEPRVSLGAPPGLRY